MENESSTKWCELTFVQACPTLENYKKENSIRHQTLNVNKQNLIKTAKKHLGLGKTKLHTVHGGHAVDFDCLVPVPVVFESA